MALSEPFRPDADAGSCGSGGGRREPSIRHSSSGRESGFQSLASLAPSPVPSSVARVNDSPISTLSGSTTEADIVTGMAVQCAYFGTGLPGAFN